jgi:AcrR family transcriptional regulator
MKVSNQEKTVTRKRILAAASEMISEKGFKSVTMGEIARRAKVGEDTIYHYFPTKESLLYGYCEKKQQEVEETLKQIQDLHEYSLREQLQQLTETELARWLPDREFLAEVFSFTSRRLHDLSEKVLDEQQQL